MSNTEVLALGARSGIPGMNSGWILLSIVSILIFVGIVKLLIRAINKHEEKVGNNKTNPYRAFLKWLFIIVGIIFICYNWFGNVHYYIHYHLKIATALGVPIGIIISLDMENWKETLCNVIKSTIVVYLIALLVACFIPSLYNDLAIKIAITVVWIYCSIQMLLSDGSYIA